MMVRLVLCGIRECRHVAIYGYERQRDHHEQEKKEGRTIV
jgi:hypothetical protein